jgi:thiol-disulfide isomerase/thioredoxin
MKYPLLVACFLLCLIQEQSFGQEVPVRKIDHLEKVLHSQNDTLYVINFWATWCKPCIQELPDFEKAHQAFAGKKVKILLVSVDYKEDLDTKVKPFIRKRKMQTPVVLLDEPDYNAWIDKISSDWSGAIPATLFIHPAGNKRQFIERPVKEGELESIIHSYSL